MTKKMGQNPSLVVYMGAPDQNNVDLDDHHEPWVKYVPGSRTISVTCAGDGIVKKGLLYDLPGSLGNIKNTCTVRKKEIRIAHNMLPPYFAVHNGSIDQTNLESPFLQTFLEKFSLRPSFLFAQQVWGSLNKTSGIWNGILGLVRYIFKTRS